MIRISSSLETVVRLGPGGSKGGGADRERPSGLFVAIVATPSRAPVPLTAIGDVSSTESSTKMAERSAGDLLELSVDLARSGPMRSRMVAGDPLTPRSPAKRARVQVRSAAEFAAAMAECAAGRNESGDPASAARRDLDPRPGPPC
jgi:hypothetical protein